MLSFLQTRKTEVSEWCKVYNRKHEFSYYHLQYYNKLMNDPEKFERNSQAPGEYGKSEKQKLLS